MSAFSYFKFPNIVELHELCFDLDIVTHTDIWLIDIMFNINLKVLVCGAIGYVELIVGFFIRNKGIVYLNQ